jgi:hypothetical protein
MRMSRRTELGYGMLFLGTVGAFPWLWNVLEGESLTVNLPIIGLHMAFCLIGTLILLRESALQELGFWRFMRTKSMRDVSWRVIFGLWFVVAGFALGTLAITQWADGRQVAAYTPYMFGIAIVTAATGIYLLRADFSKYARRKSSPRQKSNQG